MANDVEKGRSNDAGRAILRSHRRMVAWVRENARWVQFDGYNVPAVNSPVLQSELGHALAPGEDFAVVWWQQEDGRFVVSLRSEPNGANVGDVALSYGGGGHAHSAGFVCDALPWAR